MLRNVLQVGVVLTALVALLSPGVNGRAMQDIGGKDSQGGMATAETPYQCAAMHRVGKLVLTVANNGTFGNGFLSVSTDCFTARSLVSCQYPKGAA
ncbi:MAG TPA: hypothetical protein VN285_05450, partial [Candidatus Deferrimicrobium sp.]|nr:hypothetical protein [Candidatus Deferrimicrobium sp.]